MDAYGMSTPVITISVRILEFCYSYPESQTIVTQDYTTPVKLECIAHKPGDVVAIPERQALTLIAVGKAEPA